MYSLFAARYLPVSACKGSSRSDQGLWTPVTEFGLAMHPECLSIASPVCQNPSCKMLPSHEKCRPHVDQN